MPLDDSAFQASMDAIQARIGPAVERGVGKIGLSIVGKGMALAPVKRGTLRRSIHMEGPVTEGTSAYAKVFPSVIYARRIELGFMNMRDSLGRLFHQRAHPYFKPGVTAALADAPRILASAVTEAMGG